MRSTTARNLLISGFVVTITLLAGPASAVDGTGNPGRTDLLPIPVVAPVHGTGEVGPTLDLGAPDSEDVGTRSDPGTRAATASTYSPAQCTGRTDYPHKSGQQASVHARIRCQATVSRLETVTVLTRDRWYGPEQVMVDSAARNNATTSTDAHPHWTCTGAGTYTYRGYSQHASLEGGTVYKASTSNWQVPGLSRFVC